MTDTDRSSESLEEALAHYGVKGMKWGVRKDDKSSKSKSKEEKRETKAQKFELKASVGETRIKDINSQLASLPPGMRTAYRRGTLTNQRNVEAEKVAALNKDAQRVREGKLTSTQRNLLIGGAVVGALALSYGAYQLNQSGQLGSLKVRGEAFLKGQKFDFLKNDAFAAKMSPEDVLSKVAKGVNPNYKLPGGQMNCRRSSFAYELRRRGYDVQATTTALGTGHTESGLINALTPGQRNVSNFRSLSANVVSGEGIRGVVGRDKRINPADIFSVDNVKNRLGDIDFTAEKHGSFAKSLLDKFSGYPDGARGEVVFDFTGFGHSMSWERFGGKTVIFDTQKAQMYDLDRPHDFLNLTQKWGVPRGAASTRLDNMDLDKSFLSRWAKNTEKR